MALCKHVDTKREMHGMSKTPTWVSWTAMLGRCLFKAHHSYPLYGGAGVTVCDRWRRSFASFLADMGERPPGTSIDRIDGSKGYEPGNCRWATRKEQNRNQFDLRFIEIDGKRLCVAEWAELYGIPDSTFRARLKRGWPPKRSLETPVRPHKDYERKADHGA